MSGRSQLDSTLDVYEKRRNAAALPMYELTTQLASFAPPAPAQAALMRSLRGNQAHTNRFFGVITGSIPMADFFSPPNILRLLGPLGLARLIVASARRPALAV